MIMLVKALNISQVDLLGFSMGGCSAQMAALNDPEMVRKLIPAGTSVSQNADSLSYDQDLVTRYSSATSPEEVEVAWAESFFTHDNKGKAQFKAYWARLSERTGKGPDPLNQEKTVEQMMTWGEWEGEKPCNSAARLTEFRMPVFVATGDIYILVATKKSFELVRKIPASH